MAKTPVEGRIPGGEIRWPLEDHLEYLYANHFAVLDTGNEIVLVFGNFLPTGLHRRSPEEIQNYLKTAEVNPVAKIVLSKQGFSAFFELLRSRKKSLEDEETEDG